MSLGFELFESWNCRTGTVNSMDDIIGWVDRINKNANVKIERKNFPGSDGVWFYDENEGLIRNRTNTFFQIIGFQVIDGGGHIVDEQPLIRQSEIGYLGIICKKINGVLNFLMQAKIEPGNINCVQISPTIQATKSNFTRMHGGAAPAYLDYFVNSKKYHLLVDQIQSEQSSRFYKKRNRNIVIMVTEPVDVLPTHMWMTLGQIKELLKIDNLVNMDTRTVLSCLPFCMDSVDQKERNSISSYIADNALFKSFFYETSYVDLTDIYRVANDRKMFSENENRIVPISGLDSWIYKDNEIICKRSHSFKVIYCDIMIEGREVKHWEQPMIEALGVNIFGLFTTVIDGIRKYLITIKNEIGCFDVTEMGPSVQLNSIKKDGYDKVEELFMKKINMQEGILADVMLSEEGGRFYHEQNRNMIIEIDCTELDELPDGYFWESYSTLNNMSQINNVLNIQLRNLITLIEL